MIAPSSMDTMANFGLPSARIMALSAVEIMVKGKREGNDGDGEDDVCRTVSQISDTPANKNLVDDVVECVYHQRNDTGDGEFDDQPTHRFGCKRTFV